ncbi:MAG: Hsp20/alpha crystallin family protein [Brumimicrobium sp.]
MEIIRKNNGLLPSFFGNVEDDFFGIDRLDRFSKVAVNIKDHDNDFLIEMAIPGIKKEDVDIEVDGSKLRVSAETKHEVDESTDSYTRREFSYGSFTRSFTLPKEVDGDNINASCKDGVLSIEIPKPEAKKKAVKKIALK